MKFRFKKSSRTTAGLLAGAAFIALAINSWGLSVRVALLFFAICLVALAVIIGFAAILAYIIRLARDSSRGE